MMILLPLALALASQDQPPPKPQWPPDGQTQDFPERWSKSCVGIGAGTTEVPRCAGKRKMDEVATIYEDPYTGEQFWVADDGSWAVPRKGIVHESFGNLGTPGKTRP